MKKIKKREHENLSSTNIEKVISLLNPAEGKGITKKEACEILNISYNTSRLDKIIEDHLDQVAYRAKRRADLKGKPASKIEITDAVTSYLRGESISTIASDLYRSPSFVRNLLERVGVPMRPANKEEGAYVDFIPDACVSEDFKVGEIVWSAKYHRTAVIRARYSKEYQDKHKGMITVDYEKKYGAPVYAIYILESAETEDAWANVAVGGYNAVSVAYDLGKLSHLEDVYGVDLARI